MRILGIVVLGAALGGCASSAARAGAPEEIAYSSFEALCLAHLEKPADIARLAGSLLQPVPESMLFPIFGDSPGQAWFSFKDVRIMVALFESGACGLSAPDVDGDAVMQVFQANSKNRQIARDEVGTELETMFAVTYPDRGGGDDRHALIMFQTSKLKNSGAGMRITGFSEEVAKKMGLTIPPWP
jgi:hypothetical protein